MPSILRQIKFNADQERERKLLGATLEEEKHALLKSQEESLFRLAQQHEEERTQLEKTIAERAASLKTQV